MVLSIMNLSASIINAAMAFNLWKIIISLDGLVLPVCRKGRQNIYTANR